MAQPGTPEHRYKSAKILAQYADAGFNPTTAGKLRDLSECGEPDTEAIARSALESDKKRKAEQMYRIYGHDEDGEY